MSWNRSSIFTEPLPEHIEYIKTALTNGIHPSVKLPNFGVSYNMNHAKETIHLKSLEEQAIYADLVAKASVSDEKYIKYVMDNDSIKNLTPRNLDSLTNIGNIAYLALYSADISLRQPCISKLEDYKIYRLNPPEEKSQTFNEGQLSDEGVEFPETKCVIC